MLANLGYVLTDDIVVNYKTKDRDECLHFLTYIDSSCKNLEDYISPTAKRIYTSNYNAWFLKQRFKVEHIDVQGFNCDTSYKLTYKGNTYIYSFIDSKFTAGSVALLLHGSFGTYLYTGNFAYYSAFVKSPVLLPVIEEKALTRLYLDNTYYEQPPNFFGFDELADKIAKIIRSESKKHIYLYADRVNTCPLLAEIASKLEEKVYICKSTMQIMMILGYGSLFTCDASHSRIFIDKAYIKKRGHDNENISIQITRHDKTNENSTIFLKNERKGNSYHFHFYPHSSHKEICELLLMLKPESMTCLFSDLDKSKVNYNLDFKPDTIQTRLFKSLSDKATFNSISGEDIVKNNEGTSTTHENENLNIKSMFNANKCTLRVRNVPEINGGIYNKSNPVNEISNKSGLNVALSNEGSISMNNNVSLNEKMAYKDLTSNNLANHLASQNLHNYCKTKQTNNSVVEYVKLSKSPCQNQGNAIPGDGNHQSVKKAQISLPLVIDRKLVKENARTISNDRLIRLPKGITEKKKLNRNNLSSNNSHSVASSADNISKSINSNSENTVIKNKQVLELPCSVKKCYKALQQPHSTALNMSSLYGGWMGNNSIPGLSSSLKTPENVISSSEKTPKDSISENCIPDQEIFKTKANRPGEENKKESNSISGTHDVQKNDKSTEIEVPLNDTNLLHLENNNGSISNKTNLSFMDNDSNGIIKSQSTPVECSSGMNNSPLKTVGSSDTSSCTDVTKSHMQYDDIAHSMVSSSSDSTNLESIKENNSLKNVEGIKKKSSKRALSVSASDDESSNSKKKLRSDNLRMCLFHSNDCNSDKKLDLKECQVLLKRNDVERSYFYSTQHKCHLPKFCGFKKHQVRPRQQLLHLRNLQKIIKRSCSK